MCTFICEKNVPAMSVVVVLHIDFFLLWISSFFGAHSIMTELLLALIICVHWNAKPAHHSARTGYCYMHMYLCDYVNENTRSVKVIPNAMHFGTITRAYSKNACSQHENAEIYNFIATTKLELRTWPFRMSDASIYC